MVEILTVSLLVLVVVICFGNGLLYFGEDKNSPLMKTLVATLVVIFIICISITFVI